MSSDSSAAVLDPVESLPVTFFDVPVLAVRRDDGRIYLNIRDLCSATTMDHSSQLRRLRSHSKLRAGMERFRAPTAGGVQVQDFLALERVSTWLLLINVERVGATARPRISYLQDYLIQEVHAAFMRLAGMSTDTTAAIEDLDDVQRLTQALDLLTSRQTAMETSQQHARTAWRDLKADLATVHARLDGLEQSAQPRISPTQRGHLYQCVQAWAEAKSAQDSALPRAAAFATCWGVFKATFTLARYEDLPAARYPEAVAFVSGAYRQITGQDLSIPEQTALDLGADADG